MQAEAQKAGVMFTFTLDSDIEDERDPTALLDTDSVPVVGAQALNQEQRESGQPLMCSRYVKSQEKSQPDSRPPSKSKSAKRRQRRRQAWLPTSPPVTAEAEKPCTEGGDRRNSPTT